MAQVCADVKVQLINSTPGKPRGRGKVKRVRHHHHRALLDAEIGRFIVGEYHHRVHQDTGQPPVDRWSVRWRQILQAWDSTEGDRPDSW